METKIIDFHSHILPGIDDGSPDVSTSLDMLHMAAEQGVQVQFLTPHYYPWKEDIHKFIERRSESFQRLQAALTPDLPRVFFGAEVAFFQHMSELDLEALCIGGSHILLVELPFESWPRQIMDVIATLSLDRGFQVVLAHVERYLHYKGNLEALQSLSSLPIYMQVNAESFLNFFGRKSVLKLLRSGLVRLLGSDAHNCSSRKPNLAAGRQVIQRHLGEEFLHDMDRTATALLEREQILQPS